jgi:hypothetical protein
VTQSNASTPNAEQLANDIKSNAPHQMNDHKQRWQSQTLKQLANVSRSKIQTKRMTESNAVKPNAAETTDKSSCDERSVCQAFARSLANLLLSNE